MRLKRLLTFGLALMLMMTVMAPATAKAGRLQVDDDGVDCPDAAYTTIQAAIDAAVVGDKIEVCSGTYFGAVVDKGVHLAAKGAKGSVIINDGPFTHPGLFRAGFIFEEAGGGSGATIQGFHIQGVQQVAYADDTYLDFAVFSRGVDDVSVVENTMDSFLQAVTTWNGNNWKIEKNVFTDLWTINGGGIAVIVAASDGGAYEGNTVKGNTIQGTLFVCACDGGGYDGTGIALYADFRYGRLGASSMTGNKIEGNTINLTSDTPAVVNVNGIELSEVSDTPLGVISGNLVKKNIITEISGDGIVATESPGNMIEGNTIGVSGGFDLSDDSAGSGTAGTANTYKKNHCDSSSPGGLC